MDVLVVICYEWLQRVWNLRVYEYNWNTTVYQYNPPPPHTHTLINNELRSIMFHNHINSLTFRLMCTTVQRFIWCTDVRPFYIRNASYRIHACTYRIDSVLLNVSIYSIRNGDLYVAVHIESRMYMPTNSEVFIENIHYECICIVCNEV